MSQTASAAAAASCSLQAAPAATAAAFAHPLRDHHGAADCVTVLPRVA